MDLNKKRSILGILIITLICGALSVVSALKMFEDRDTEEKLQKQSYILLLEKELGTDFKSENDFENFAEVGFEMNVIPTAYQYYIKPCFDFKIVEDGVIITNRLAKEFDEFGFKVNDKIVEIDDQKLKGKTYFEITELILAKSDKTIKIFTFSDGRKVEYTYIKYNNQNYNDRVEYDEYTNTLFVYNLDNITTRSIYDRVKEQTNITLDLSKATVTTLEGIVNFISLFSNKEAVLFKTPENIIGQKNRKINELNIVVGDNNDNGILFALTSISRLNSNIKIDRTDLNTTKFYAVKRLASSTYIINLKNVLIEAVGVSNNSGSWI